MIGRIWSWCREIAREAGGAFRRVWEKSPRFRGHIWLASGLTVVVAVFPPSCSSTTNNNNNNNTGTSANNPASTWQAPAGARTTGGPTMPGIPGVASNPTGGATVVSPSVAPKGPIAAPKKLDDVVIETEEPKRSDFGSMRK